MSWKLIVFGAACGLIEAAALIAVALAFGTRNGFIVWN